MFLTAVGVDEIHDDRRPRPWAVSMSSLSSSGVPKRLEAAKKLRDVVAEGAVVGMLLDGHELNGVVTGAGNPGQDALGEFPESSHAWLLQAHSDMGFVDSGAFSRQAEHGPGILERVGRARIPVLPGEIPIGLLYGAPDIGGDSVHPGCRRHDMYLEAAAVPNGWNASLVRQEEAPHSILIAIHGVASPVPAVEIADKEKRLRARRPFPIPDAGLSVALASIQPEKVISLADGPQEPSDFINASQCLEIARVPGLEAIPVGRKPGVRVDQAHARCSRGVVDRGVGSSMKWTPGWWRSPGPRDPGNDREHD